MKFSYSIDEENYHGEFSTADEAAAVGACYETTGQTIYVGENVPLKKPEDDLRREFWLVQNVVEYVVSEDGTAKRK